MKILSQRSQSEDSAGSFVEQGLASIRHGRALLSKAYFELRMHSTITRALDLAWRNELFDMPIKQIEKFTKVTKEQSSKQKE